MKEDKFIVEDATDIMCIGGFGNLEGNLGLLKYSEKEIAQMIIDNNTEKDNIRLTNSLLKSIEQLETNWKELVKYLEDRIRELRYNIYKFDTWHELWENKKLMELQANIYQDILDKVKSGKYD